MNLRRRAHRDPVTEEVRQYVLERDGYRCLGPRLGAMTQCRGPLTLDHVKSQPMMGKRAPSRADSLVTLCQFHHVETRWATSHRDTLRAYLRAMAS